MSVFTFQPLILIYGRDNFVYHHWGCTWVYRPLSYPFRSLYIIFFLYLDLTMWPAAPSSSTTPPSSAPPWCPTSTLSVADNTFKLCPRPSTWWACWWAPLCSDGWEMCVAGGWLFLRPLSVWPWVVWDVPWPPMWRCTLSPGKN